MSLTIQRIAEIRRGVRKGREYGEMTDAEWNELLTLAQKALQPEAARTISAGGSYELKMYGTPGYTGTITGVTFYADPDVPEHTVIVRDDLGRELGRIINIGGSSTPQNGLAS